MKKTRIALCQISPVDDREENVHKAYAMIDEAAANGADLAVLPELFYSPYNLATLQRYTGSEQMILDGFCARARRNSLCICTGSMVWPLGNTMRNRSHLISNNGSLLLQYDKCHLFDVNIGSVKVEESSFFSAGDRILTAETPCGRAGVLICYDIRFPEAAREIALQGAEFILVPAVFNQITGKAHWHSFMKTRAVENQVFLAAVSTGVDSKAKCGVYRPYGHSMVVSPWGDILAEAGEDECIVYADCDPEVLENTRQKLPLLQHRRGGLYTSFTC